MAGVTTRFVSAASAILVTLLVTLVLLALMELVIRMIFPQINYQGIQASLFLEDRFNQTMGLVPNSSGEVFGKEVRIDQYGFRQMDSPTHYDASWLFLGDSVTFGVGIEQERIFPQLIQNHFQQTKIWNTAVAGYSTLNYLDVVRAFLHEDRNDIEKVVLFFCLNDVYGNLSLKPSDASVKDQLLSFLRANSKLFLFLKKRFFDRSKAYALFDISLYAGDNPKIREHLNAVVEIKAALDKAKIDFLAVILPYEYQLRVKGLKAPQTLLNDFFAAHDIASVDLYEDFTARDSEDYFLYGDPMHLSVLGHETVAEKLVEVLRSSQH